MVSNRFTVPHVACRYEADEYLDVTVDVSQFVCLFDAKDHLGDVKLGKVLLKDILLDQEVQKVSSRHVLHDQVQMVGILERVDQLDNPLCRLGSSRHEIAFCSDVSLLALLEHISLAHHFHGKVEAGLLLLDKLDHTKGAMSDCLYHQERVHRDPLTHQPHVLCLIGQPLLSHSSLLSLRDTHRLELALQLQVTLRTTRGVSQEAMIIALKKDFGGRRLFDCGQRRTCGPLNFIKARPRVFVLSNDKCCI